jgi:ABC-type Fe3+/spermidine/putrescine transport system ATPase subunit
MIDGAWVLELPAARRSGGGVGRDERRRRAEAWLATLGIVGLAGRPAHTLSGGEAQRVSLARALAVAPRVLLLDEPFAGLDAPTRGELLAELRSALADTGTAALLVTHDHGEAAALADRIGILHAGELRQEGPAGEVLDAPADRECARILGFDTILPAALLGLEGDLVALRPSACTVAADGLAARLRRLVPLGGVTRVVAELDGETVVGTAPSPPPPWLVALRPGDPVGLRIDVRGARPLGHRATIEV